MCNYSWQQLFLHYSPHLITKILIILWILAALVCFISVFVTVIISYRSFPSVILLLEFNFTCEEVKSAKNKGLKYKTVSHNLFNFLILQQ